METHVTTVSALDADLRASEQDLVEPTPYVHAERALGQTGRFVRKHGGVVGRRPDHGTLANDPDEHYKDGSAKKAVVDDIDLAAAQLNESFGADYAVREEDSQEVDVFTLCQEQSRDVIVAMGAIVDLEQELIEEGGFHIVKINPIKYRSLGDSAQDDL